MDASPAHERVAGDGEQAQSRGPPAPDERPDPRPNRSEPAVRRRSALGEDRRPPRPEEPDRVAEVAGRPGGGAAAPEVVESPVTPSPGETALQRRSA